MLSNRQIESNQVMSKMGKNMATAKTNDVVDLETKDRLYRDYANAVEQYVRQPTSSNWEKKEKAFECYNALIETNRKVS